MRAQAGLNRVNQQQAAVGLGQLAGCLVEVDRDRAAWIAWYASVYAPTAGDLRRDP